MELKFERRVSMPLSRGKGKALGGGAQQVQPPWRAWRSRGDWAAGGGGAGAGSSL